MMESSFYATRARRLWRTMILSAGGGVGCGVGAWLTGPCAFATELRLLALIGVVLHGWILWRTWQSYRRLRIGAQAEHGALQHLRAAAAAAPDRWVVLGNLYPRNVAIGNIDAVVCDLTTGVVLVIEVKAYQSATRQTQRMDRAWEQLTRQCDVVARMLPPGTPLVGVLWLPLAPATVLRRMRVPEPSAGWEYAVVVGEQTAWLPTVVQRGLNRRHGRLPEHRPQIITAVRHRLAALADPIAPVPPRSS